LPEQQGGDMIVAATRPVIKQQIEAGINRTITKVICFSS